MKAILEFSLPEENHEYLNALQGAKMRSVLWDLDQWMRAQLKFQELSDGEYDGIKQTRDKLRALLQEENIDINE